MNISFKTIQLLKVILVSLLLVVFAFFIHFGFPYQIIAFAALGLVAFRIAKQLGFPFQFQLLIGELRFSKRLWIGCLVGIMIGVMLAFFYRYRLSIHFVPLKFQKFAIIASFIGIGEELIFRGYLQGQLVAFPKWVAVSAAALSHTLYKCAIFISSVIGHSVNIPSLFVFTFLGGLLFGYLKEYSKSTIPPAIAHALFDIIVYCEFIQAPWWVW